ncbi:MAG: hypothetical protein ACK55I_38930, partial [bacterium]
PSARPERIRGPARVALAGSVLRRRQGRKPHRRRLPADAGAVVVAARPHRPTPELGKGQGHQHTSRTTGTGMPSRAPPPDAPPGDAGPSASGTGRGSTTTAS